MYSFKESQEEDGDIEAEEAEGEENDRPYNLRQRKTVERYQAPPIGKGVGPWVSFFNQIKHNVSLSFFAV